MRVALGADHAGVALKDEIKRRLGERGVAFTDFGTGSTTPVDYPDVAAVVAREVASGSYDRGILLCGSGLGMAMAANKVRGIRAVSVFDEQAARLGREHNDANVLSMGARIVGIEVARDCLRAFLAGEFQGGRHVPRIEKIHRIEAEEANRQA